MFNKGQLAGLMKQAQAMQENMKRAQDELATIEVSGPASLIKNLDTISTLLLNPRQLDDGRPVEINLEEKPFLRCNPSQVRISLKKTPFATPDP